MYPEVVDREVVGDEVDVTRIVVVVGVGEVETVHVDGVTTHIQWGDVTTRMLLRLLEVEPAVEMVGDMSTTNMAGRVRAEVAEEGEEANEIIITMTIKVGLDADVGDVPMILFETNMTYQQWSAMDKEVRGTKPAPADTIVTTVDDKDEEAGTAATVVVVVRDEATKVVTVEETVTGGAGDNAVMVEDVEPKMEGKTKIITGVGAMTVPVVAPTVQEVEEEEKGRLLLVLLAATRSGKISE
jgi:hypothetical protein